MGAENERRPDGRPPGPVGSELAGATIVITRSAEKADELRRALEERGARVLALSTIRHAPETDLRALDHAARRRSEIACIAFTSQTAVTFFLEASLRLGLDPAAWAGCRLAAVGARTAAALRDSGLEPWVVAGGGAGALADALLEPGRLTPGDRVLLPRSSMARPELAERLERAGLAVSAFTLYHTLPEERSRVEPILREALEVTGAAAVVFASPSAVAAFLDLAGEEGRKAVESGSLRVVSIGPTTSAALYERALPVASEARSPNVEDIVRAAVEAVRSGSPGRDLRRGR